jgi:hypothetical protein
MKKLYTILALICLINPVFSQNKKEQISALTHQIDSLNAVVLKERTSNDSLVRVLNADINVKKEEIQSLNTTLAENQRLVSVKNSEILLLQEKLKSALDSVNVLVQMLESQQDTISYISLAEFRQINKNNIHEYDVETFMGVFKGLETRFYVEAKYLTNPDELAEEVYFEMLLDSKVVVRGYVVSGCGDCFTFVVNHYTLDGFLYLQHFVKACEPFDSFEEKINYFSQNDFAKGTREFNGSNVLFDDFSQGADDINIYYQKSKTIPKTFRLTLKKPDVFECVYLEIFE